MVKLGNTLFWDFGAEGCDFRSTLPGRNQSTHPEIIPFSFSSILFAAARGTAGHMGAGPYDSDNFRSSNPLGKGPLFCVLRRWVPPCATRVFVSHGPRRKLTYSIFVFHSSIFALGPQRGKRNIISTSPPQHAFFCSEMLFAQKAGC